MATTTETHLITRDSVRRFAIAIGADDPIYFDPHAAVTAGYRDIVAPRSYFLALGLAHGRVIPRDRLGGDGLPQSTNTQRILAGETSVIWYGDMCAGDVVTVSETLVSTDTKVGRSGPLTLYRYERHYACGDTLLVREEFTRIGR
jgi:hypothetical protein